MYGDFYYGRMDVIAWRLASGKRSNNKKQKFTHTHIHICKLAQVESQTRWWGHAISNIGLYQVVRQGKVKLVGSSHHNNGTPKMKVNEIVW